MKQQQRVSKEASKTVQAHMGESMGRPFSNNTNLSVSQRSFTIKQQWGEKVSAEAIEMVQAQVEIHEHMQSKDVQAASETNVFTWTLLPFSADHSMDIKKNTF